MNKIEIANIIRKELKVATVYYSKPLDQFIAWRVRESAPVKDLVYITTRPKWHKCFHLITPELGVMEKLSVMDCYKRSTEEQWVRVPKEESATSEQTVE